ncbi:MAG: ribosome silencing factor [Oscillospiraceae bacterium]|jgi:ribosome-associated protein|nr:ribosome silencing factor [Oscillospiraceae bacterium]
MDKNEKVSVVLKALDSKKAQDIKTLMISEMTTMTECFIIATGISTPHVRTLSDEVEDRMTQAGEEPLHIEGYSSANWIVLDYSDVVVHIFSKESREFYKLERLWNKETAKEIADDE